MEVSENMGTFTDELALINLGAFLKLGSTTIGQIALMAPTKKATQGRPKMHLCHSSWSAFRLD